MVFVEQYVHVALEVADRASVLNRGSIVMDGPAGELSSKVGELEQAYLGGPEPAASPGGASGNGQHP